MPDPFGYPGSDDPSARVFATCPDPMAVLGASGVEIVSVNPAWRSVLGYEPRDLIGRSLRDLLPSRWRQSRNAETQLRTRGYTDVAEKEIIHKNGSVVPISMRLWLTGPEEAPDTRVICLIRDITFRQRAFELLRESEDRYRTLISSLSEGIILQDMSGRITKCNASAQRILRLSDTQIIGHPSFVASFQPIREDGSLFPAYDHPAARTLRTGESCSDVVMGLRRTDGTVTWISISSNPILPDSDATTGSGGLPTSVVSTFTDITDRRRDTEAAIKSEARFRAAADGSFDSFFVFTSVRGQDMRIIDFRFVYVNPRGAGLVHLTRDQMIGKTLRELFPGRRTDDFVRTYKQVVESRQPLEEEFPTQTNYLEARWLRHQILPFEDGVAVVTRDISERKASEARQRLFQRELDHRVKNSIGTILALAKLGLAQRPTLAEFKSSFIGQIGAIARAHEVMAHDYDEGVDLRSLMDRVFAPFVRKDDANFTFAGDNIVIPPNRVQSLALVLYELATNAVKHGALSQPEGRIHVDWAHENNRLQITWTESGGPPVVKPTRMGMGTDLIDGLVKNDLHGHKIITFDPTGVVCDLNLSLY